MKKIWFCIAIIIIILSLGIAEEIFIHTTFDDLSDKAIQIYDALIAENHADAFIQTEKLQAWWTKKRDILEFLCPNADIKDIAKEIGELVGCQKSSMYADAITRTSVISAMAKNSKSLLSFRIKNVF